MAGPPRIYCQHCEREEVEGDIGSIDCKKHACEVTP